MSDEKSTKPFGPIRDDYSFFEQHSNEAESDLQAYLPHLKPLRRRESLSMLDFGCGDGKFTASLLSAARFPVDRLTIRLVEPDPAYRERAVANVASFSSEPVLVEDHLPANLAQEFDLIASNHVLYYVVDLKKQVKALAQSLRVGGTALIAMAGMENIWLQFWKRGFELIDKPVPFYMGEDLREILSSEGIAYETENIEYQLDYPDSPENRLKMLRFLFDQYLPAMPRESLLAFFDPYSDGERVRIDIQHCHYIIQTDRQSVES